jgi:hypothetical protein
MLVFCLNSTDVENQDTVKASLEGEVDDKPGRAVAATCYCAQFRKENV